MSLLSIRSRVARVMSEENDGSSSDNTATATKTIQLINLNPPLNGSEINFLIKAIQNSSGVQKINLADGSINGSPKLEVAALLSLILSTHRSLKSVNIGNNNLNDDDDDELLARVITTKLKSNTSLEDLYLYANNFGGRDNNNSNNNNNNGIIRALAGVLPLNKSLLNLHLGRCKITVEGARILASGLEKDSTSLKYLKLADNDIGDEGGQVIANSLRTNKSLQRLILYDTGIGDKACEAFGLALRENNTLITLMLDSNTKITNIGAAVFEVTLKHLNYRMEYVALPYNIIISSNQRERIVNLCFKNERISVNFRRINDNIPTISLGLWPKVLELVECKPDLLFALLKTKPDICREQLNT